MGRSVIGEESLEALLLSMFSRDKWLVGLVLGQNRDDKDYVLHLAGTPQPDSDQIALSRGKLRRADSLEAVDEGWIVTHTRQIMRMLPGGLDVIGVFALIPPEDAAKSQTKLRSILYATSKFASKSAFTAPSNDRIVLQICSKTRKLTCRTYDISDPKCSPRPAEWKIQRFADKWHCLETQMALDWVISVPNDRISQSLEKQILSGLRPLCDDIQKSVAMIDHKMAAGDGLLDENQNVSKKGKKQDENPGKFYTVQMLDIMTKIKMDGGQDATITDCCARLTLRGTMCCRAFAHNKASKEEGIKLLKKDVVRSLTSRCELLCEDLLSSEEDQDPKVLYEMPLRVFAPLGDTAVQLCDYMFQDETNNEVVDRFKELLGVTVPEDTVDNNCETWPVESELLRSESRPSNLSMMSETRRSEPPNDLNLSSLLYVLGAVIAVFAVVITYFYKKDVEYLASLKKP